MSQSIISYGGISILCRTLSEVDFDVVERRTRESELNRAERADLLLLHLEGQRHCKDWCLTVFHHYFRIWWVTVFNENDRRGARLQICWFIRNSSVVVCKREIKPTVARENRNHNWQNRELCLILANFSSNTSRHNGHHRGPLWVYWFGTNL